MPKEEKEHPSHHRPNKKPTYRILSFDDINEVACLLGDPSPIDGRRLGTRLSGIAFRYELERQAGEEPSFSEQQSQFTKIKNAADELLELLVAEDCLEMSRSMRVPLQREINFEARALLQQWRDEGQEVPAEDQKELDCEPDPDTRERDTEIRLPLGTAIWTVLLIGRAAANAADIAASNKRPGRGGKRNMGKRHEVVLLESLFQLHDDLHRQYPAQIKPPGISTASDGETLTGVTLRFTKKCLGIFGRHASELCLITDDIIRHRFRGWRAKLKEREKN